MKEWLTTEDKKEASLLDEELFLRAKQNPALFSLILDRYQEAFWRKARSIVRSDESADDVVQEAFTKMYLKSHLFTPEGDGSFKSWAYRVLINTALTHYQKMKRDNLVSFPEEAEELFPDKAGIQSRENKELSDYISSILVKMPDHFSSVLSRFFLEGKSQEEIANEDGVSVGAIKTKVYRAKELFRKIQSSIS